MACDSGPQEPPPPWPAATAVGAPEQRRRLLLGAVLPGAATTRHVPAQLGAVTMLRLHLRLRRALALADAVHHAGHAPAPRTAEGSSKETTGPDTVLLLPSSGNSTKEASSTQEPRFQVMSSMDSSTVDLLSYLQDPKAARLLAEKTREIWQVPCQGGMEECVTAFAMLLRVAEETISAPVSVVVVEGISTAGRLQLSGSSRTASLFLKNTGWISDECLLFSVDSEYFTEFFSVEFGLVEKAVLIGLKRESQFPHQSIGFVEFEGDEGVVDARYQMLGKRMDVKGAVAGPYLPAEIQRNTSRQFIHQWTKPNHKMLDGEPCEKDNIYKWCPLPVQCLPSWFSMSEKWLPGYLVRETEKHKEMYPLNDLEGDSGATYVVELGHGVHGYDKAGHSMHLPLLQHHKSELAESKSDYQYPTSLLTANITGDSPDTESQKFDPCSESNSVESQEGVECRMSNVDSLQGGDSDENDSSVVPIFVRHVSGELTLTVSLDQSSQYLMDLYAQKTKTKLECQHFVYGRKTLEPDRTFLFYGLKRDTTVHVCTGLLGGKPTTLAEYVYHNKNMFTVEVALPDGRISLQMTMKGCQFLSSWTKCFTAAFTRGQSWNGKFTLEDFKYVDGHIRNIRWPTANCPIGSMAKDLIEFVKHVEGILCYNKTYLISKYPPYLQHFIRFANRLIPRLGATNVLTSEEILFLETHVCFMTSYARERLIIELFRKYEGRDVNEDSHWEKAIETASCSDTWNSDLLTESTFFVYLIEKAKGKGVVYNTSRISAFIFVKDTVLHAADSHTDNANAPKLNALEQPRPQLGDGIELMLPAHLEEFLPSIILNLIEKKIDISAELLTAVQCACRTCGSSY